LLGRLFKEFYHRLSDGVISFFPKILFRQAGLLRDPLVEGRFKEFNTAFQTVFFLFLRKSFLVKRDYSVIPFWGGGSKNFITAFQTVLFLFL